MNWTEKYRPRSLKEVIGNEKAKELLLNWAKKWVSGIPNKKAVILYGKAGVGKTTSAYALAHDFNWQVIELNASDERNKDIIKKIALSGALNETIGYDEKFISGKKKLIILDEADNLYEKAGDYGGKRAIIDTIKKTKQPIILIANDYYNLIKGSGQILKQICLQIEFEPVGKREIANLLKKICKKECIEADDEVLYSIAIRSNGDVRSAINDLQSLAYNKKIGKDEIKYIGYRDREKEIFTGLREILRANDVKTATRIAYRLDETPENLILWIDENLPKEYINYDDLHNAYEFLSKADIFLGRTWKRQHYGLWGYATELMTGGVAVSKKHNYKGFRKYSFPSWLRSMAASKQNRAMKERVAKKIGILFHCSKKKGMEILPYIKKLVEKNPEIAFSLELDEEEMEYLIGEIKEGKDKKLRGGQKKLF